MFCGKGSTVSTSVRFSLQMKHSSGTSIQEKLEAMELSLYCLTSFLLDTSGLVVEG